MASNDSHKRQSEDGRRRILRSALLDCSTGPGICVRLDLKRSTRHVEYKEEESSKVKPNASQRKVPSSEGDSNKNKFDKRNCKTSDLHAKTSQTSKEDLKQSYHTQHRTSNEIYSDKKLDGSGWVNKTKNVNRNVSKAVYCDENKQFNYNSRHKVYHQSFSEGTNSRDCNKYSNKSHNNSSFRNLSNEKAAKLNTKETRAYQEKSWADNEDSSQSVSFSKKIVKSPTTCGNKEVDNSFDDNKVQFSETSISYNIENSFCETHSTNESHVLTNTVAELTGIPVVNTSIFLPNKNICDTLNNNSITKCVDKFENCSDSFADYINKSTILTESTDKIDIIESTNYNANYINTITESLNESESSSSGFTSLTNNICKTESVEKIESATSCFPKFSNNNSILNSSGLVESSTSSLASCTGNIFDITNDCLFTSDSVFILPPIPPPTPKKSEINQSSIHTSGYTSATDLDYEEILHPDNATEKENCLPDDEHYAAITSFLNAVERKYHQSNELAEKFKEDILKVVRYYFTGNRIVLYGSYYSDLAVSSSDINVALIANQAANNSFFLQLRKKLFEKLKDDYHVESFEPADNPRKSKIYLSDKENGINCELVYAGNTVKNFINMNSLIQCLCEYDSRLKTLLIAIRIWTEKCTINETENGTLHIVGFSLMFIYFLQQLEKPVLPVIDITSEDDKLPEVEYNNASIGQLWLEFFQFYSSMFDWKNNVICITSKEVVSKHEKSWKTHLIAIEDPFTKKNIGITVIKSDVADYMISCFTNCYDYFLSPDDEDIDSNSSLSNSLGDENLKFSFNHCVRLKTTLPFCEKCDELGGPCDDCLSLVPIFEEKKLPEISKESLEPVQKVLEEVYDLNILSFDQIKKRKAFVKQLEEYIRTRYSGASLSLFGSSVNGFGFASSDLDICMTFKNDTQVKNQQQVMRNLCGLLRRDKNRRYGSVIGLYRAVVPLVKFSNLYCKGDISFSNLLAVHNSKLLNRYARFDERCRKLGCALKLLAKKTGIADCTTKSLSSYSYIIMTIHYLQQIEPPVLPVFPIQNKEVFEKELLLPEDVLKRNHWYRENILQLKDRYKKVCTNDANVGQLWIGLLDFYINYDRNRSVTITQLEPLPSSELSREARIFNIQDPFLPNKNLGSIVSESKAHEIFKIFYNTRVLFSKGQPKYVTDLKDHYFSTMNLTGKYEKDKDCPLCGAYGHDKNLCEKACFQRQSPKKQHYNSYKRQM